MDQSFKVNCTLHKGLVDFKPITPGRIKWYNCGPTVYGPAHLGHARNYVTLDMIRRIMENYFKYEIDFVQNITDIDDKIINKANHLKISTYAVSRFYEADFFRDMTALNVLPPTSIARATEVVQPIIDYIQELIDFGFAYPSKGSVYFRTQRYKDHFKGSFTYPQLKSLGDLSESEQTQLLNEGEGSWQSSVSSSDKENPTDFVMWKAKKEGEPSWPSPWGEGRPGWHIECSAMSHVLLGDRFDIHSGGEDLKFPHHDNEIAQSQAFIEIQKMKRRKEGKVEEEPPQPENDRWVNYWLHSGHLCIDGLKMSKSLKNFTSVKSALEVVSPRLLRLLFASHKFNDTFDFSEDVVTGVRSIEKRITDFLQKLAALTRERQRKMAAEQPERPEQSEKPEETNHHPEVRQMMAFFHLQAEDLLSTIGQDTLTSFSQYSLSAGPPTAAHAGFGAAPASSTGTGASNAQTESLPAYVAQLRATVAAVDAALRNSFDIPRVIDALMEMIRTANTQKQRLEDLSHGTAATATATATSSATPSSPAANDSEDALYEYLCEVRDYLLYILGILGFDFADTASSSGSADSAAMTKLAGAFTEMCHFRDQIRATAQQGLVKKKGDEEMHNPVEAMCAMNEALLKMCDEIRDERLPPLGVRLEDRGKGQPAVWMLVDPEELMREKLEKQREEEAKAERKRKLDEANREKMAKKLAQAMINPAEMFKNETIEVDGPDGAKLTTRKYAIFDDNGLPTHDHEGKELSKNQAKYVQKAYEKQKQVYAKAMKEKDQTP